MRTDTRRIDRPTIVAIAVTAVIVLGAVVAVAIAGEPTALDPATPEGVVQRYTNAVLSGDRATALELMSSTADTDPYCEDSSSFRTDENIRVSLRDTRIEETTAIVDVRLTFGEGDDPFGSAWSDDGRFELVFRDEAWRIERVPWQLTVCP